MADLTPFDILAAEFQSFENATDAGVRAMRVALALDALTASAPAGTPEEWGVTQTIVGDKDGNCLEAAIATILGCAITDVPKLHDHTWNTQLTEWLSARGVEWATLDGDKPSQGLSVAVGPSPRRAVTHAVVAINGKLAFDPHPDRTFFAGQPVKYFIELSRAEVAAPPAVEARETGEWRELAFLQHGHKGGACLYGDDGELSCSSCGADFKRMTPAQLRECFVRYNLKHHGEEAQRILDDAFPASRSPETGDKP